MQRLLSNDKAKSKEIMQEIKFLKSLSGHPNIIKFISAASVSAAESGHGRDEYLVCTEYCHGESSILMRFLEVNISIATYGLRLLVFDKLVYSC